MLSLLGVGTSGRKPLVQVLPVISGLKTLGLLLSVNTGTWSGNPTTYTYQWRANGSPITGATSNSLLLTLALLGVQIDCVVTATNSIGSTPAITAAI